MTKQPLAILAILAAMIAATYVLDRKSGGSDWQRDPLRMAYSPLHFKPAIDDATDAQCLACHGEILDDKVRSASPAGFKAADAKAWYQRTSTYRGEQDTFHRRHLATPMAKELMNLKCNTCHQGHDPREEAPGSSATGVTQDSVVATLRKQVNPETTCLRCHGQMPWQNMGLPGTWGEFGKYFGNSCVNNCHERIRTVRHRVNYLKPEAIEAAGAKDSEVCHGCHGGRPWYRISFPYPRHSWPEMGVATPAWAVGRPTQSEARFLKGVSNPPPNERKWLP